MNRVQSDLGFRLMSFMFRIRDILRPRMDVLKEAGIKTGDKVLDYGCGPGSYIIPLAGLAGKEGTIYALDINPLAIRMVQDTISKKHLTNVKTILSDSKTGLPDKSIDVVLFYDVLHNLDKPDIVLEELQRILKQDGKLSVSDHHLKGKKLVSGVTNSGFFRLSGKGERTYSFMREG